jgi:putative FmdB family regulatory protein
MPTYDYECDACGHKLEMFQSITESPKRKCPNCGRLKLRRLFGTGAAVMFKGSGFYQTDYRSESYKKRAESDRKAAADSGGDGKSASGDGKSPSGDAKSADRPASSASSTESTKKPKPDAK